MNGSQYIAEFLKRKELDKILVTGGAVAFIVDAIGQITQNYIAFNMNNLHRWLLIPHGDVLMGKMGVSMATSGPGAVNLLSGLGCSYVDSIPSISITGQVNIKESSKYGYAKLRQAGYHEIDIVKMAKSVTKFAIQVNSAHELKYNLEKAYHIATSEEWGRY